MEGFVEVRPLQPLCKFGRAKESPPRRDSLSRQAPRWDVRRNENLVVIGLGFTEHDSSAAIVINGKLTTAIARERLTRIKRDGTAWGTAKLGLDSAIQCCLDQDGLSARDVDVADCF
jgi:Carbamoyltransferase N-terminus